MQYKKVIIYYFSGTGNAKMAANLIYQRAIELGINAELYNIERPEQIRHSDNLPDKTLLGFCFPTHGFNASPNMISFIFKFKRLKNCEVFILNTRAGMKFLKYYTPGLSGIAQLLPASILYFKGYKIVGWQPLDMPSNWISVHPGLRKPIVEDIIKRCTVITHKFIDKLLENQKVYKGLRSLPIDLLLCPISCLYYFVARFFLAKTFIASYSCNNCGLCEKKCPVQAIKNSKHRPYWTFKCESCMRCLNNCPLKAIETPHAFVITVWIIIFTLIQFVMVSFVSKFITVDSIIYEIVYQICGILLGFPFVYISYKVLHFLMRYKFFNYIIIFTSLTKLPFWRRYTFFNKPKRASSNK